MNEAIGSLFGVILLYFLIKLFYNLKEINSKINEDLDPWNEKGDWKNE